MTTSTTTGQITCNDGSFVAFEWIDERAPSYEWVRDREHWPAPLTPMELAIWSLGHAGVDRAWDEMRLICPPVFYRFQFAGPYFYARTTPPEPELLAKMAPRYMEVGAEYGSAHNCWKSYSEPRIIRACEDIAAMPAGADFRAAAETLFYGFHQTFTCLALLFLPNMRLSGLLAEIVGEDAELTGFELTQGGDNATQMIDEEIWKLAELARGIPAVAGILNDRAVDNAAALAALRAEAAAAPFLAQFDDLIARHGRRGQGWTFLDPTWSERPDSALALVRAELSAKHVSPDELRERTATRRREANERVLALLPAEKRAEFDEIMKQLEGYVETREGRAYWQLVIVGAMRGFLLRNGEDLVRRGRLDQADDVLFVTPEDIASESTDLRPIVAAARKQWEHYRDIQPPLTIGTPGEVSAMDHQREAASGSQELRGSPGSRGTVTGTARILHSPEDGACLQQGDILVTVMTTPAWTPLFAIAGGIITETGGALSHPAITAREYGIPAVLALRNATTRLRDGQQLTLDGATGVVTVQG